MADESIEITATGELHIIEGDNLSYNFGGDGTSMILVTSVPVDMQSELQASKFENARIRVVIEIDYPNTIYEGVTP